MPKWVGSLDPMMVSLAAMVASTMLPAFWLEATGTRPGLSLFSVSLGGEALTTIAAAGLGAVFTLAGHCAGHLLCKATHAEGTTRAALLGGAAALLAAAVFAVAGIGGDRSNNLQAKDLAARAALLNGDADEFDRRARSADRRAAAAKVAGVPASAEETGYAAKPTRIARRPRRSKPNRAKRARSTGSRPPSSPRWACR